MNLAWVFVDEATRKKKKNQRTIASQRDSANKCILTILYEKSSTNQKARKRKKLAFRTRNRNLKKHKIDQKKQKV